MTGKFFPCTLLNCANLYWFSTTICNTTFTTKVTLYLDNSNYLIIFKKSSSCKFINICSSQKDTESSFRKKLLSVFDEFLYFFINLLLVSNMGVNVIVKKSLSLGENIFAWHQRHLWTKYGNSLKKIVMTNNRFFKRNCMCDPVQKSECRCTKLFAYTDASLSLPQACF